MDSFLLAFENYYVKMPSDRRYYKERWQAAKVDFNLSYGVFDNNKLIAFVIHAIDTRHGELTAFNTGTGVIPKHRGKKLVKSIYEYALSDLKLSGISKSTLEVITKNNIAIRSYESIGFKINKTYKCFNGVINLAIINHPKLQEIDIKNVEWDTLPNQHLYSWDNQKTSLSNGNYKFFNVLHNNNPESYFIINPDQNYLAQFDLLTPNVGGWNRLFSGIHQISEFIRINNVDDRFKAKLDYLNLIKLNNSIDQYEMVLKF